MGISNIRDRQTWQHAVERELQLVRRGAASLSREAGEKAGNVEEVIEQITTRRPTAPVELVYETDLYTNPFKQQRGRLLVDFPAVTKSTDAKDIIIYGYELWGYNATVSRLTGTAPAVPGMIVPGSTYPGATPLGVNQPDPEPNFKLVATSGTSDFRVEEFDPGDWWVFKVRARATNSTVPGNFSPEQLVQFVEDTTPLVQPAPPTARVDRGTITVSWNGQSVLGAYPPGFSYAILSGANSPQPTHEIARFGRAGGMHVVADIEYYDVQYFRVQAFDEAGNASAWSETVTAYTTPLVDRDVILSTIDGAKTILRNIDAGVAILENTIIAEHLVATEALTAKFAQFLTVRADQIDVNSLAADEVFTGLLDAKLVRSDMFEGEVFTGGKFYGTLFETDVEENKGMKWGNLSLRVYGQDGVETFRIDNTTGNVTMRSGTLTGLRYQTDELPNTGIKIDRENGFRQWDDDNNLIVEVGVPGRPNLIVGEFWSARAGTSAIKIRNETGYGWPGITFSRGGSLDVYAPVIFGRFTIAQPQPLPELVLRAPSRQLLFSTDENLGLIRVEGDLRLSLGAGEQYHLRAEQPFFIEAYSGPSDTWHYLELHGDQVVLNAESGNVTVNAPDFWFVAQTTYYRTTSSAPNLYISEDGKHWRSVSGAQYKVDLRPVTDLPDTLLDVHMSDWYDRDELERKAELSQKGVLDPSDQGLMDSITLERYTGFSANEVEEKGGDRFVIYGENGEVESLQYDRFTAAQVQVLIRQLRELQGEVRELREGSAL